MNTDIRVNYLKQSIKRFEQNLIADKEEGIISNGQYEYICHEIDDKNSSLDYKYGIAMCYYITIYKKGANR